MKYRPRLSAVLLTVNIAIIALPLGSIFFFRIYENQLIQETERELISQAAVIGAVYRQSVLGAGANELPAAAQQVPGRATRSLLEQTRELTRIASLERKFGPPESPWSPINPRLDLARVATFPSRPDGKPPTELPSASAASAGRALSPILDWAQKTSLIGVRVLDQHGTTVGGTAEVGMNFAHVEEVAAALKGRYASALRARALENAPSELSSISRGTGVRVFVAFPVIDRDAVLGAVYLSRTPKSILRHVYEEREKAILALITVLIIAVSLAWLTSRTISRPVAELLKRTRRVSQGESAGIAPLEHSGTREIAELSHGISQMAASLSDRAAYIRTLASQVSHEFKTPLTSIEGAAELLRDHHDTMTAEERQRFLENISGDGARLRALLDRLLDLARAENAEGTETELSLTAAVQTAGSGLSSNVCLRIEIPTDLTVRVAEQALNIVFVNLFDNAVRHGADEILVTAVQAGDLVEVRIQDNGDGITPGNREKIFENFFTTRRDSGGTGLGLGIVRALLTAHGATIELAEAPPKGAVFALMLRN